MSEMKDIVLLNEVDNQSSGRKDRWRHFPKTKTTVQYQFGMIKCLQKSQWAYSVWRNTSIMKSPSWWFQPIWKILVKLDHFPK